MIVLRRLDPSSGVTLAFLLSAPGLNRYVPGQPGTEIVIGAASGICSLVGRATTFVGGDVGSIPTCCALEVWQ